MELNREEYSATVKSLKSSGYRLALTEKVGEGFQFCLLDADCTGPMENRIFRRGNEFRGFLVCTGCGGALSMDHP